MSYELQAYNHADAHRAVDRMEREGENASDHVIGCDTWDDVRNVLDDEETDLGTDTLRGAPYRVLIGDGIVSDARGWIDVRPVDTGEVQA